jgi:DNA-binding FrmR family transcriptional regulator
MSTHADTTVDPTTHGYTPARDALLKRLSRIEGQVRGVSRMVDENRYCIDVLTQISAVQAALDKVALGLMDDHVHHCVVGAPEAAQDERADELMQAVRRLMRAK